MRDGVWEYRSGSDWVPLSPGAVERVVEEKELLARAKDLAKQIEDGDVERRAHYAEWLFSEGLTNEGIEGIEQLDRALREDPDAEAARTVLARSGLDAGLPSLEGSPAELPDRVDALLRRACQFGPTGRELGVMALGELGEEYPLRDDLSKALVDGSPRRRAFAALALRRLFPGEELKPLLVRAVMDASESVREEAALALAAVGDASVAAPVVKALESQHPVVRSNAAQALGNMGYEAAVPPLMARLSAPFSAAAAVAASGASPRVHIFVGKQFAYIQDFDVEVAQFEAVADPQINVLIEGAVLEARVLSVQTYTTAAERASIRRSLQKLTGAAPGNSVKAWQKWWEENGSRYEGR
jgi:hypothetical protein